MKFISEKEKRNYYIVVGILNKLERGAAWRLENDDYVMWVEVDGVGEFLFRLDEPKIKQRLLNIINK